MRLFQYFSRRAAAFVLLALFAQTNQLWKFDTGG